MGEKTAMPSGRTIPWMLHGTPSRKAVTRTRSQRAAKYSAASRAWSIDRTHRT